MKIAVDVSPLTDDSAISHRVRGIGSYIENLKKSLVRYFPNEQYIFFSRGQSLKNIDIVHYPYFEPFFLTLPIRKRYKTVVTVHDLTPFVFPKEFPYGYRGFLKWLVQKFSLKKADAVIADSECSRQDIIRIAKIPKEKVFTVSLAAEKEFKVIRDNAKFLQIKRKYNLPEKFALYVGDVTWNKNLPSLLKAIETIKVSLVMVGKVLVEKQYDRNNYWNKDLVTVQEMAKKNSDIIRLGYVSIEELIILYNMATVFVMPSLYEGFGLPILEAMQCGCPVVTTKEGSLKEISGDAAFFVDAYNIKSIASGIEQVIEDKRLQRELSEKGLIQAKKFSWEETARKTMQVYNKIYDKTH